MIVVFCNTMRVRGWGYSTPGPTRRDRAITGGEVLLVKVLGRATKELLIVDTEQPIYGKLIQEAEDVAYTEISTLVSSSGFSDVTDASTTPSSSHASVSPSTTFRESSSATSAATPKSPPPPVRALSPQGRSCKSPKRLRMLVVQTPPFQAQAQSIKP